MPADAEARVAAIYRQDKTIIPDGNTVIEENDTVFFLAAQRNIRTMMRELRPLDNPIRRIILAGGGNIGSNLARNWSFPESLVDAIRYHHRPEDAARNLELAHTVYLADLLMSRFNSGLELEWFGTETLSARLEALGLTAQKFPDIVDLIPLGVFDSSPELALRQK